MDIETPARPESPFANKVKNSPSEDLAAEIMLTIDRRPGERVRCVRVYGDRYRCNWIARESSGARSDRGLTIETHRIVRSKFLRVSRAGDQLQIDDLTGVPSEN